MPNAEDIRWFKRQFHTPIEAALAKTPFDLDMIVAVACQETGHIWSILRKKSLSTAQIVALSRPNKFCHGFGVFQYDLQFFLVDPDYFLESATSPSAKRSGSASPNSRVRPRSVAWRTRRR